VIKQTTITNRFLWMAIENSDGVGVEEDVEVLVLARGACFLLTSLMF